MMEQKDYKRIARFAYNAAQKAAERESEADVMRALKDQSLPLETIMKEHFSWSTQEEYDFIYTNLKAGRDEYLATGKITMEG